MPFDDSSRLDEADWIRHRTWRLMLLRLVTYDRALAVIDDLIAEAEERVERIAAREFS